MSSDYAGIATIIAAILTPLSVVVLAWLTNRKVGHVGVAVERVEQVVGLVNHAVNGKDPRDTTLSEDVIRVRDKQERDMPSLQPADPEALLPLVKQLVTQVAELRASLPNGDEWKETRD